MNNITKIISNKIIIIATILALTMTYVGLVTVYAKGVTISLNTNTESHGRNSSKNLNNLVNQTNREDIYQIKIDLEKQLKEANTILNILDEKKASSNTDS